MGFFDFLKNDNQAESNNVPILKRLNEVAKNRKQAERKTAGIGQFIPGYYDSKEIDLALLPSDIKSKMDIMILCRLLPELNKRKKETDKIQEELITNLFHGYSFSKAELTDAELFELINNWKACTDYTFKWSTNKLLTIVSNRIGQEGLTELLKKTVSLLKSPESEYAYSDSRKINEKIEYLLLDNKIVPLSPHDNLGKAILAYLETITDSSAKQSWINLISHCLDIGEKSSPQKKWLDTAKRLTESIEPEKFKTKIIEWLSLTKELIIAIHKNEITDFLRDVNHNALKSLIWCTGLINDPDINVSIDSFASIAYKKKPGTGSISIKTGNACMYAFSLLPFKEGITRLMKFRNKIVNNTILKSIDRIIAEVAQKNGYSRDYVEEIGVMDFGLDQNGIKRIDFGTSTCTLTIKGLNNNIQQWEKAGKSLKSIPAEVKSEYASKLKNLKNDFKEIEAQLQAQKDRIEKYYLKKKSWKYNEWKENYLDHNLVKIVAAKLIWLFKKENEWETGFFENGNVIASNKETLNWINSDTEVQLWHPIHSSIDTIIAWRNFIQSKEITQPFKQAYREVYILTDAELKTNTYSNRFAAHILRQHQFAALCRQRGWQYHLMGNWDSHNTPGVEIPAWNMSAQYYVDSDWNGMTNDLGIFTHIATDQVRFYKEGELLELIDVPKLVFTEIMRDVDLFVGVTSIGNDPQWSDTGDNRLNTYWREYSFGDLGESAKMRREVLQKLIPRLKIAGQCSFDGKFLVIKGQLRTYKIHIGSGNILMEPNDQYLCIVPAGSSEKAQQKVYLPFEGDSLLSIIISKTLLLAEDLKIKDETITRQIKN